MLDGLQQAALAVGLELHPDKTKIMSNTTRNNGRPRINHVNLGNSKIEILPISESLKYLGRDIGFEDTHHSELNNRIRQAWAKFMKFKQELTSKHYPLKSRIRLFESTVTPTMLYGCQAWTLTQAMEATIQRTQRRMLRMILGARRRTTDTQQLNAPQQKSNSVQANLTSVHDHDDEINVHNTNQLDDQLVKQLNTPQQESCSTQAVSTPVNDLDDDEINVDNITTLDNHSTIHNDNHEQRHNNSLKQNQHEEQYHVQQLDNEDDSDEDIQSNATAGDRNIQPTDNEDDDNELEPWHEWAKRATTQAEMHLQRLNAEFMALTYEHKQDHKETKQHKLVTEALGIEEGDITIEELEFIVKNGENDKHQDQTKYQWNTSRN